MHVCIHVLAINNIISIVLASNVWPLTYICDTSCPITWNQCLLIQNVFILRSVSNSALSGAINSREFIDLVGNYSDWGGAGVYISSGKRSTLLQCDHSCSV